METNSSKVVIKNVRFSYAHVFTPDEQNNKYSVQLIIAKDHPQIEQIKAAIQYTIQEGKGKLGDKFRLNLGTVLHDGDIERIDDENYEGCYYINARSNQKPNVVKRNTTGMGENKTMEITDPTEFYSGCYGMASVAFFAFNTQTNKGIGCALNGVCKVKDGQPLGGTKASAESDFGSQFEDDDENEVF